MDFEKQITYGVGKICAMHITPIMVGKEAAPSDVRFDKSHFIMGHPNKAILKETAKNMCLS